MAKALLLEDAPPDGYMDGPPDGYEDTPTGTTKQPTVNTGALVVRAPTPGAKPLSPAMAEYRRGFDSFLAGDRSGAETHSKEALRIDPKLTEASQMLLRLKNDGNAGTRPMEAPKPTVLPPRLSFGQRLKQTATDVKDIASDSYSAVDTFPVVRSLGAGAARIYSGLARVPNLASNLFALPYNAVVEMSGRQDLAFKSPKSFEREAKWWDQKAQELSVGHERWGSKGETLVDVVKRKNPKEIASYLAYKVLEEAPQQAVIIGSTLAGAPSAGLAYMGTSAAAQEQAHGDASNASPASASVNSIVNGLAETAFEMTPALMGKWSRILEESVGKKSTFEIMKNVVKTLASSFVQEGPVEEGTTELFQSIAQKATGVDPNAMQGITGRVMEASALGGIMGAGMTAPAAIGQGLLRSGQNVAPIDRNGQPEYLSEEGPDGPGGGSNVAGGSPSVVVGPTDGNGGGGNSGAPPDGFVGDVQPDQPTTREQAVPPSSENVALPPSTPVQNIGQGAQPQSETAYQPPVEPSAKSGKVQKKQIKKEKQLTPIEGLASIVPRRSTLPILTGFNVKNGVASATDMTSYFETKIDLPDGHYKMVGKNVEKSGLDAEQFPVSPKIGNKIGTVDRSDLIRNFDRVEKASSDDEARFILQSVNLKAENGKAYLTATDGRRLSTSPLDSAKLPDGTYNIPANLGVGKSLKALSGDTLDISVINDSDGKPEAISFTSPNGRVVSRLIEGNYPQIDHVIPEPTEQIVFSKPVIENALKELKPYTKGDKLNTVIVNRDGDNISFRVINPENKLDKTISVKGKTIGGNFAKIKAGSIVMPMQMNERLAKLGIELGPGHLGGFQLGYLQDAVSSVSGNEVYLGRLDDPHKPIVIRGKPFDKFVAAKKAKRRGPGKGSQASTGGENIESFERQTGPIFYSQLQRTIEQKMPNSSPVSMVRALIDPTKGNVKAEEVEWSGINEFLAGKEKVSKAELLDFLKSNEVKIQEVVRSDDVKKDDGLIQEPTKFAYHQLPGGSNYREVLLTLPADQKLPEGWTVRNDLEYGWIVESKGGEVIQGFTKDEAIANARQRLLNNRQGMGDVFKSPHFDEPNILAHVRMNDRTTTDGKHVLFLEEVQSDWHQKGREKGYRSEKEKLNIESIRKQPDGKWTVVVNGQESSGWNGSNESSVREQIIDGWNRTGLSAVPNAPFKKTWHELALKRMLRYAVDNGYDGIAWTTGEQQAERYDLSKQVSDVEYRPDSKTLLVLPKGAFRHEVIENVAPEKLADYIGKDASNKLLEQPIKSHGVDGPPSANNYKRISGLDLKVGGEGMRGFYDQIIPAFLNKYTKKWGGKVAQAKINIGPSQEAYDAFHEAERTGDSALIADAASKGNDRMAIVHALEITPSMRTSVSQGQPLFAKGTAKGSSKIESFEQFTPKEKEQTFKMAEEVRGLVSKYAVRVGEKYVPRRAEGAYYPETQNIRLKSLNDLSVAVHEITHSIDDTKAGTSRKIIAAKDRETLAGLTEIYATYYAPGKSDHPVRKRIVEGLATLIQKTAETPTIMRDKYGTILDKFIKPEGRYYDKNYADLLTDSHGIVGRFQELDKLGQVGAFVTSKFQQKEARSSFLSVWDKIRTTALDAVWPVEKAAKKAGVERTASDPSLWMRANQAIVGNIENNMVGSRGFWIPTKEGGFRQVSDKNFSDLLVSLGENHLEYRFGWWLIARDSYFEWQRLDQLASEIEGIKEKIQLFPETMTPELMAEKKGMIRLLSEKQIEHDEFLQRLNREPLGRSTFERAYLENKDDFQAFGETFDTFTRANLDLIEMADLATPEQLDVLRQKEGYAPKKRDIYDDIIGSETQQLPTIQVGKTKLSSMMARKGSSLSYINPLYSVVKDHAEIMRKSMRQMVYNKMLNIAPEWPEIFQPTELKVVVDKATGRMSFPQEKDPNIIMARGPGGKRHPLLVGRDMKKVIDDVLSFHDLHVAERVLRKAARIFSQGTTGLYPPFVLTNIAMDLPTAMANTRTKMIPVFDALKDLNKALLQNNSPEAKYAREWFASHGERQSLMGWQNEDPDDFFRLLQKEKNWIMRATKSTADVVDFLSIPGKYSEIMSRLTEYVRSRKAGNPWLVAMEDSARVTTPFVHMGRWGGGTWMKTLIKSISLFNPSIQALDQFVRSAGQKDTQKRVLFVLVATVVASAAGMSWLMKHATDEQKDQYKDLEGKSLTNYAWFPAPDGKNLIKVRVAEQYGWLAALTNLAIGETIFGIDYKFRDYADAATSWVPDQFDISHPVMALLNLIPQLVKPSLEVVFDRRTYPTVRPLTPRNLEHVAPGLRSIETTSPVAKELGKRLDLSPIAIDHLVEGYLGRTARFGTMRFSSMKMNPFFQDWYFTSGRNLQDFYDTRERWQYINKEFKTNPKEVSAEDKKSYFHNGPIIKKIEARLDVIREYQKTGKPLTGEKLYRNRHAILEDIAKLK